MTRADATPACVPFLAGLSPRLPAALGRVVADPAARAMRASGGLPGARGFGAAAGRFAPVPVSGVAVGLAAAAVVVNLLVSGNLLAAIGIPYAAEGGSLVVKLHPGTYLSVLAVVAMAWRQPAATLAGLLADARVPMLYLGSLAGCCGFALAATGRVHLVVFVENFMPAGLLALVLGRAREAALRRLAWVVLAALVLGVAVSVGETLLQTHLVPIVLDGREELEQPEEFRGAGLFDHPLTGAMLTAAGLFLANSAGVARGWRAVLTAVFAVGLVAFGGRTALVLATAVFAGWQGAGMLGRLAGRALRRTDLAAAACALTVAPAALALLLTQTGVGARLVTHLYWDDSAQVRNVQWLLLPMMDPGEKLFGMTLARQELALRQLSLHWRIGAVENFWLLLYLYLGAAGFAVFVAGFVPFLCWAGRRAALPGRLMLGVVMLAASTSNSLGHKANLLTVLVPMALASAALRRPSPRARASATADAGGKAGARGKAPAALPLEGPGGVPRGGGRAGGCRAPSLRPPAGRPLLPAPRRGAASGQEGGA